MNIELKGNEALFRHTIKAPRIPLFKAWTDPVILPLWWGPLGAECKVCQINLKVGGGYKIHTRFVNGEEQIVKGSYIEIAEPERLVFTLNRKEPENEWSSLLTKFNISHYSDPELSPRYVMTVNFEELNNETALNIQLRFNTKTECSSMMDFGTAERWAQSLERLSGLVEYLSD